MINVDLIKESIEYDEVNGVLVWSKTRGFIRAGKTAGGIINGAMYVTVGGSRLLARDIVWYLTRGQWPKSRLYHKNGDRSDVRISNLSYKPGISKSPADDVDFGVRISEFGYTVFRLSGDDAKVIGNERGLDNALSMLKESILCSK